LPEYKPRVPNIVTGSFRVFSYLRILITRHRGAFSRKSGDIAASLLPRLRRRLCPGGCWTRLVYGGQTSPGARTKPTARWR